ncbi:hypothetical protein D3C79_858420 [compost metagenome]
MVAFGDVTGDLGKPHQAAVIVVHRVNHYMRMERRAIFAQARADLFETPCASRLFKVVFGQPGSPFGIVVEHRIVLADDLVGMVPLGPLGAGVPVGDDAFGGEQVDGIVHHALDQKPVHDVGACD